MTGRRHFLIAPKAIVGNRFKLNGSEGHHLSRVTRIKTGETVYLLDMLGRAYIGKIDGIQKDHVEGAILQTVPNYGKSKVNIHLGVGILKGSKMDTVVEKGTELGMHSFTPLRMRHNVKQIINLERLKRISKSAIKQCGRGLLPMISSPMDFQSWCDSVDVQKAAVAVSGKDNVPIYQWLRELMPGVTDLWLAVGPEGGFHSDEIIAIKKHGIPLVSLGPRRLRSETAVMALLAICDNFFEGTRC